MVHFVFLTTRGVGTRAGSAAAPQLLGRESSAPPEVCRCDKTDGDDYLQVEVTSIGLFLLCTKLTKLVDIYDIFAVLV